ncbi:phosphoethanolamine--lipid A transferase [Acinetobacter cumulans]|uniref:Phosphoethanolamine--lipid A transferase n=1 Tax=Acinetobacter cumulans TaxID=2136182 RepID=A0A498D3G1_9GAMM|nr:MULTISPECIES: phosphoethanolamine--lipid A transferase [Acinetobacter]RKG46336.1 phosphoethanolamine--lipid A transferase [Acinetobacter cumulans]RKG46993.1 phosphoethanolamine--lipid A transferase [Acinetobacter cumulans]RLL34842.1 phosphoethanolamine--lipid A transferase [Acinetobacter cumulans]RZG61642.1 phosphoethanolamine--lipid A transferase [Acinetobacter sp. WCHAc060006]
MFESLKRKWQTFMTMPVSRFNLLVSVWLAFALNIGFYQKLHQLTPYQGMKSWLFLIASVLVVTALYNILLQLLQWRWTAKVVALILLFIGGFSAYFVCSLGVVISPDQIQNAMQTDPQEVKGLMSIRLLFWSIFMVALPMLVATCIPLKVETKSKILIKKGVHLIASFAVLAAMLFVFYVDYAAIFRQHRDLKGMISPQNAIAAGFSYFHHQAPKENLPLVKYGEDAHLVEKTAQAKKPKLMVLVVGETARAESFSLNGYAKNTNPELSKLDVINFSQVSSCGTATAVSVPCMFSGMPRSDYDENLANHREGLLDIAQRAGYKVTWIDNNSGCKGTCTRVEQVEISPELKKKWCTPEGECYDQILVDALNQYIEKIPADDQTPRLIVLHQVGSHGPAYYARATPEFQKFKPTCDTNAIQGCTQDALINSYDNSIVYTDHILSEVIQSLKANSKYQTGFWYLSDHGESTGEYGMYLHGAPYAMAPSQQTHVPMIMWFSAEWKAHQAANVSCLSQQKSKVLSQDNLFPSLLSILGVQTQVIDAKNDMLQNCKPAA